MQAERLLAGKRLMKENGVTTEFLTVGHSNRELGAFLHLLQEFQIERVVDVRKMTRSHATPQFDEPCLQDALSRKDIAYEHLVALGGLRGKTPGVPASLNGNWRNASFRRYADYALTEPFRQGLGQLMQTGAKQRCVIMCAEALWWRCHRRIVSDHLIAHGCHVQHILKPGHAQEAQLTLGAVVREDLSVIYPASEPGNLGAGSQP